MIIIKIMGGLGNQMFQYAYAKALQKRGHGVKIDVSVFDTYALHGGYQLDKYKIGLQTSTTKENNKLFQNNIIAKFFRRLGYNSTNYLKEKSLFLDKTLLDIDDDRYVSGYFQTELYFKDIRNILLDEFSLKVKMSAYTKEIEKNILLQKNSCSIHVRRGDFISSKNETIHGVCDLSYYINAMELLNSKYANIKYFIFSDDIGWVKENFKIDNITYVESDEERIPHEDMYLMSLCHHNIIANSSFSWWGAWLNENNEKIVIAPKRWFVDKKLNKQSQDIVPEEWMKI